jgi:hypothetical protein
MNRKLFALAAALTAAVAARAQAPLQADVTALYADHHESSGVSLDVGAAPTPPLFLGAEWTYLDPAWTDASGGLPVHLSQEIDTFDAVARYTFTLWRPGYAERAPGPGFFFPSIDGYVGGGAGVATVWERRSAGAFGYPPFGWYGFTDEDNGEFTGELAAGIQISLAPGASLKVGYRYVAVTNVRLFGATADIDKNVVEAGFNFRF